MPTFKPKSVKKIKYNKNMGKTEEIKVVEAQEEQTKISEITPFIPFVIEAILDDTLLPRHEDTGWGYVSHQASQVMQDFAFRVDRIERIDDARFSFFNDDLLSPSFDFIFSLIFLISL